MPLSQLQQRWMHDVDHALWHRRGQRRWEDFADPAVAEQYPPDLELEPTHLEIDLHVDVANQRASGQVTTTVAARRAGAAELTLQAIDLEDVQVRDADDHELAWRYDGERIVITWADPLGAREERRVIVHYRVVQPVDGLFFSRPDAAYPAQPWYATTDHETERARHWLPCVDHPNVRTTLDLRLRAESRFTIVANGYLVEEVEHEDAERQGTKTAHWRLEQPCPSYLICFAIGDFTRADDGAFHDGEKEIPCAYFCSPEHSTEDLLRTFGRTKTMLAWMTQKLDMPFPYPQ
jgi:aminopeptidase N